MMEEKNSIKISVSTVIILILILFIVFLLGYIYIIKNTKHELSSSNNNIDTQENNIYTETNNISNNTKENFVKFELIIDEGYNAGNNEIAHYHIVGKKEDGTRKEIIAVDEVNDGSLYVELLGVNQNKLYYTDNKGFAYIDLSSNNYERTSWIDFDEKKLDYSLLRHYLIKNDKLYFEKAFNNNDSSINSSFISSIYSIEFTDKSLDDATLIIENAEICGLNMSNNSSDNSIYYTKFTDNKLYKYNLDTKKSESLFEDDLTNYYDMIGKSEILYIMNNELRTYNMNSGKSTLIDDFVDDFKAKDNTYYYIKDNKIIKVSGSDKTTIYTNTYNDYTLDYISFFEDTLVLSYSYNDPVDGGSMEKYMVNGTIKDEAPTISVNMKNGNSRQFGINLVEKEIN